MNIRVILFIFSQLVYPLPGAQQLTAESDHLGSGKYEPLVLMNAALTEEVQRVMALATSKPLYCISRNSWVLKLHCNSLAHAPHQVASSSLLSGAISKCLCCILSLVHKLVLSFCQAGARGREEARL